MHTARPTLQEDRVNRTRVAALAATALAGSLVLAACGGGSGSDSSGGGASGDSSLSGAVRIDGSSTVYPLTALAAEDFMAANPGVQVTVASSGMLLRVGVPSATWITPITLPSKSWVRRPTRHNVCGVSGIFKNASTR